MGGGNDTTRKIRRLLVAASEANKIGDREAEKRAWLDAIELDDGSDSDVMGDSQWPPFRLRPYIMYAHDLQQLGDARGALKVVEQARVRWAGDDHLQMLLGRCHADLEEWQQAADAYQRSAELAPRASTFLLLGSALDKLGRHDDALHWLLQALVIDPNYEEAHYNLGWVLERTDKDGAIVRFRRAVEIDPDYQIAHARLGALLFGRAVKAGLEHPDWAEAVEHLTRAVTLDPEDGWSHAYLASARQAEENWEEAEAHHRAAARLLPSIGLLWSHLGSFLSLRGEFVEAEQMLERGVTLGPDEGRTHFALGEHLWRRGNRADARTELRTANRLGHARSLEWLKDREADEA